MPCARSTGEAAAGEPRAWRPGGLLLGSAALHGAGLAVAALFPRSLPSVAAVLVADHALVIGAGLWPTSRWLGPNLARLPASERQRRRVGLSFDDGPDPEATPEVLDLLDRYRARASFFCVGERVERHPELAAEIARRGHRVENHTYRHLKRFSLLGPGAIGREIDRAQAAIEAATGRAPRLLRPPAGLRNALLEPLLARRGLWLASWSRRAYDTVRADPRRVARDLVHGVTPGDVLLLHDGGSARGAGGRPVVLEALPLVLDRLEAAGLTAVALEPPNGG
ncbi:MAG TPA: polysaccharide deacetylase family protein [Thermoanaerobaculia bacterium]|nr:polysaccharide deacetylase family protein [Thermoanaerobaculia bacterium]